MLQIQLNGQVFTGSGALGLSAPPTPTNFDISDSSTTGNIILTWTNPGTPPDPTTNEIWRSTDGTTFALYDSVAGNVHTYSDTAGIANQQHWFYKVRAVNAVGPSGFTDARSAGRQLAQSLVPLSFIDPSLVIHFGNYDCGGNNVTAIIEFARLRKCTGLLRFEGMTIVEQLNFPALQTIGGDLTANNISHSFTFTAPALIAVPGDLQFNSSTGVTSVDLRSVATVTGQIGASGCNTLATFNMAALVTVGVGIFLIGSPALSNVTLTSLHTSGTQFYITGGPLVNLSLPNWVVQNASAIHFETNALNAASVNGVLARGVASAVTGCTFVLNGGTNAAPSGQGIADKATLQGTGNTVTTN